MKAMDFSVWKDGVSWDVTGWSHANYRQLWQPPLRFSMQHRARITVQKMDSAISPADAMQTNNTKQLTFCFCCFFKAKIPLRLDRQQQFNVLHIFIQENLSATLARFSTKTGMTELIIGSQTGPDNSRKLVSIFLSSIIRIWHPFLAVCKTALHQENKLSKNRNGAGNLHHGEQHRESRYHCQGRHYRHASSC